MAVKSDQRLIDRLRKGAFAVDYLLFGFTLLMMVISLMFFKRLGSPVLFILGNLAVIAILLYFVFQETGRENSTFQQLHIWLPIISFTLFYVQATSYDHLIFTNTFDNTLMKWESALFGDLNRFAGISGKYLLLDELFHFFYFSYYVLLFVPGLILMSRRSSKLHEMIFSLTLMMFVHFIFFILFPGDGPIDRRPEIFRHGAVFIPLMNWVYAIGGKQGGGAFPSTHVTVTVIVFLYCRTELPRSRWLFGIIAAGICVATIYCSYHYIVDTLAGLVTGTAFYFIGKNVYSSWIDQRKRVGESLSRQ